MKFKRNQTSDSSQKSSTKTVPNEQGNGGDDMKILKVPVTEKVIAMSVSNSIAINLLVLNCA